MQPDGKIVAVGEGSAPASDSKRDAAVARFNDNGSLDSTFDGDGISYLTLAGNDIVPTSVALQPSDGKIVVAGGGGSVGPGSFVAARIDDANGAPDAGFAGDGIAIEDIGPGIGQAYDVAIDPSGGVVLAGFDNNGPTADVALARFGATGTLAGLDGDGVVITDTGGTDDFVRSVAIQPDGKIVTAGRSAGEFAINRFTSAGALDTSFSGDGKMLTNFGGTSELATVVDILPNGNIAGAGDSGTGDFAAVRVLTDAPGPTNSASGSAGPGGSVSTNTTVTPADPVGTDVTVPSGGAVTITEVATGTPAPSGFNLLGQQVDITAPAQTAVSPLVLEFHLDASLLPAGVDETNLQVFRNGVAVADCAAGAGTSATPDPCIAIRSESGGDITLTVRTSQASSWNFGVAAPPPSGGPGPTSPPATDPPSTPAPKKCKKGQKLKKGKCVKKGKKPGKKGRK